MADLVDSYLVRAMAASLRDSSVLKVLSIQSAIATRLVLIDMHCTGEIKMESVNIQSREERTREEHQTVVR